MENRFKNKSADSCVQCGTCTKNCVFLKKYGISIGDTKRLNELAYHCFLCGRCTQVCQKDIDGRQIIMDIRAKQVKDNRGKVPEKGYGALLVEKKDYLFRNHWGMKGKSILFPGCNFPSYYPETTLWLTETLGRKGIGTAFDCCGKPVEELGLKEDAEDIIERINRRFEQAGVQEAVMLCPNCYHFLKGRLKARVISIYEKLEEWGLGQKVPGKLNIFPPCPDKGTWEMLGHITPFLSEGPEVLTKSQCCGLGGCAGAKEPDLAKQMTGGYSSEMSICTYCASCSGSLRRKEYSSVDHILLKILGRDESPDIRNSLMNRAKWKYWRGKNYGKDGQPK